jgi:anti-anti-sigma factor
MLVFTVSTIDTDGCCGVVHLAGDLTRTQVSLLKQELSANFTQPEHLIIDVSGLVFVDWNGLRGLLHAGVLADGRVALVSPPPEVLKLLEATGLVRSFPIFQSVAEAHLSFQAGTPVVAAAAT